jgi:hypothetical protein
MSDEYSFTNRLSIRNTLRYFVENNVNFSIGINYDDYVNTLERLGTSDRYTNSGLSINFGFNYRIF